MFKAARLETAQLAEEVGEIARCLVQCGVPGVWSRSGTALLAQWVDGDCLSGVDCTGADLRRCGALQALVHSRPVPEQRTPRPDDTLRRAQRNFQRPVEELVESNVLGSAEARHAQEIATRFAPRSVTVAFILGDFCAENIVQRDSGELCFVDTETLSIGACEYDLGRTWYRWPMTPVERAAYLDGYREHRSPVEFLEHFPYWAITALVAGAVFRSRQRADTTSVPVSRLRALVRELTQGIPAEEAMYSL